MQHLNCHSNANVKNIDHIITKYGGYLMVKLENGQYFMSFFFFLDEILSAYNPSNSKYFEVHILHFPLKSLQCTAGINVLKLLQYYCPRYKYPMM